MSLPGVTPTCLRLRCRYLWPVCWSGVVQEFRCHLARLDRDERARRVWGEGGGGGEEREIESERRREKIGTRLTETREGRERGKDKQETKIYRRESMILHENSAQLDIKQWPLPTKQSRERKTQHQMADSWLDYMCTYALWFGRHLMHILSILHHVAILHYHWYTWYKHTWLHLDRFDRRFTCFRSQQPALSANAVESSAKIDADQETSITIKRGWTSRCNKIRCNSCICFYT